MARKPEAAPLKRAGTFDRDPDLAALSGNAAEIDAYYGENLPALLPRRLSGLLPRFARAA